VTRIIFLGPAQEELLEAAKYCENRAFRLGQDFLGEVQIALDHIDEHPRSAPVIRNGIRRRLLRTFPFGVLYRIDPEEIVVVAVMHLQRRPGYWQNRL
jgi:toxin ParE1/3/4